MDKLKNISKDNMLQKRGDPKRQTFVLKNFKLYKAENDNGYELDCKEKPIKVKEIISAFETNIQPILT